MGRGTKTRRDVADSRAIERARRPATFGHKLVRAGAWASGRVPRRALGKVLRSALTCLSLVLRPAPASADEGADEGALAEALFREGQQLMAQKNYEQACPKLAESQRLDPSTGTLLNLAVCHESQGKLASAWKEFNAAVVAARRDQRQDRVDFAKQRIASIEPRLSRVTVVVPSEHEVSGVEIQVDSIELKRPAWGVPLPLDPGSHEITAQAPGRQTWSFHFEVKQGPHSQTINVPALELAPEPAEPVGQTDASGHYDPGPEDQSPSRGGTQRVVALSLGGAGIVGLVVGSAFGVVALDKFGQSNETGCDGNDCDAAGSALRNDARAAGDIATVGVIAGGVLLATGVVLFLSAPRKRRTETFSAGPRLTHPSSGWSARVRPMALGGSFSIEAKW